MAISKDVNTTIMYCATRNITELKIGDVENVITKDICINNAYIAITNCKGNKEEVQITVGIYKDSRKTVPIEVKLYSFIPNLSTSSENFIKQGYEYLKTLPEYADAIDILEEGQTL